MCDQAVTLGIVLQNKGWQLACAESCTGGGIACAVTDVSGSSAWFGCGWVVYSNAAKTALLGVPETLIDTHGAVSEAVVCAMAQGALTRSSAHVAVAVSGVAGPGGGTQAKPVGTVWLAWLRRDESAPYARCFHFSGDRAAVRKQAIDAALAGLIVRVENQTPC
jgi:nicotinamide-nucleotide amidase